MFRPKNNLQKILSTLLNEKQIVISWRLKNVHIVEI